MRMKDSAGRVVIIGAGPAGLGTGYRLKELGHDNFVIYERGSNAGGLSSSFLDNDGFVWDLGGHVIFSAHEYFHRLLKVILCKDILEHRREAYIRVLKRWVPYPFQNNLRYLPKYIIRECLDGLKSVERHNRVPRNFEEWIVGNMGRGIARYFMLPYNRKVWAHPLRLLDYAWIDERISRVNLEGAVFSIKSKDDDTKWGGNANFKYPLYGGIGSIFRGLAGLLEPHVIYNSEIFRIDFRREKIFLSDGGEDKYDLIVSTVPLDKLIGSLTEHEKALSEAAKKLRHNGVLVVGIGIHRRHPKQKCWVYFPEGAPSPFYRVSYLSNYSPHNTPDPAEYYSLLCETAYSPHTAIDKKRIVESTLRALIKTGMALESDKKHIVSRFFWDIDYAYPIPTLTRDAALRFILPRLERKGIYSIGRFGGWRYEFGNMDHCLLQGKETAEKIVRRERSARVKV